MMKRDGILRSIFKLTALSLCAALSVMITARAQEAGGDLVGGAGIFRPKNPETTRKRTSAARPTMPRRTAGDTRPTALPPEVLEERFADSLGDANDARDARKYAEAEKAYRNATQL